MAYTHRYTNDQTLNEFLAAKHKLAMELKALHLTQKQQNKEISCNHQLFARSPKNHFKQKKNFMHQVKGVGNKFKITKECRMPLEMQEAFERQVGPKPDFGTQFGEAKTLRSAPSGPHTNGPQLGQTTTGYSGQVSASNISANIETQISELSLEKSEDQTSKRDQDLPLGISTSQSTFNFGRPERVNPNDFTSKPSIIKQSRSYLDMTSMGKKQIHAGMDNGLPKMPRLPKNNDQINSQMCQNVLQGPIEKIKDNANKIKKFTNSLNPATVITLNNITNETGNDNGKERRCIPNAFNHNNGQTGNKSPNAKSGLINYSFDRDHGYQTDSTNLTGHTTCSSASITQPNSINQRSMSHTPLSSSSNVNEAANLNLRQSTQVRVHDNRLDNDNISTSGVSSNDILSSVETHTDNINTSIHNMSKVALEGVESSSVDPSPCKSQNGNKGGDFDRI